MTGINRSIATQKSCSFSTEIILNNTTGIFWMGFNNTGNQNFLFKSGLIYDITNQPVFSYTQNIPTTISGNIESGNINYWINNYPISFNGNLPNYISGFNYTWEENKVNPSYSLTVFGDAPEYLISGINPVNIASEITGYVKNLKIDPKLSFKIFSGNVPNFSTFINYIYTGNINGGEFGQFKLNGINNIGIYNIPIQLYTNFGTYTESVQITVTGDN